MSFFSPCSPVLLLLLFFSPDIIVQFAFAYCMLPLFGIFLQLTCTFYAASLFSAFLILYLLSCCCHYFILCLCVLGALKHSSLALPIWFSGRFFKFVITLLVICLFFKSTPPPMFIFIALLFWMIFAPVS